MSNLNLSPSVGPSDPATNQGVQTAANIIVNALSANETIEHADEGQIVTTLKLILLELQHHSRLLNMIANGVKTGAN